MKRKKIPSWLRKIVFEIYDYCCSRCCDDEYLQIHHEDRNPDNNFVENLELLCIWCHILEHPENETEMIEWAIRKGIIK